MKEQMVALMTEQAKSAGVSLPASLARSLLEVTEQSLNDDDRRTALRRLAEAIDFAQQASNAGGDDASH